MKAPPSGFFWLFWFVSHHEGPRGDRTTLDHAVPRSLRSCDHRVVPHGVKQTKENKKNPTWWRFHNFVSQHFTWPQFFSEPFVGKFYRLPYVSNHCEVRTIARLCGQHAVPHNLRSCAHHAIPRNLKSCDHRVVSHGVKQTVWWPPSGWKYLRCNIFRHM